MNQVVHEGEPFDLSSDDRAWLLQRLPGLVQAHHGGRISISRVVGHVRLPSGAVLRVRSPKSPAASVLAWMAYVDPTLRAFTLDDDGASTTGDGDIAVLTARLFLRELRRAVSRYGVPRQYSRASTVSSVIRGRIEFARLMDRAGDLSKVPCSTWERQPRSATVRTIAAALDLVARDVVMRHASHGDLRVLRSALADVPPVADATMVEGKGILARNETGFASALALACVVLRRALLGEGTRDLGLGYLVNLEALFERTVVRALEDSELPFRPKVPVTYVDLLSGPKIVKGMEMDVFAATLSGGIVVDAKYKRAITASNLQRRRPGLC